MPPSHTVAPSTTSTYNDVRGSFNKYRSIAFGTWKPGEAKRFSEKGRRRVVSLSEPRPAAATTLGPASEAAVLALSKKPVRRELPKSDSVDSVDDHTLVPAEDDLDDLNDVSEIENCKTEPLNRHCQVQTTPSLCSHRRHNTEMTVSFQSDLYSSTEYLNYCLGRASIDDNRTHLNRNYALNRSMDALNDRLVHSKKGSASQTLRLPKASTSAATQPMTVSQLFQPLHQRTRSFDSATYHAVISPGKSSKISSFGNKSSKSTSSSSVAKPGALQATKNFLKKLYNNSTTLPRKLKSGKSNQKLDRFKAATSPFFEIRYPEPEEIPYLPYNIQYEVESEHGDETYDTDRDADEEDEVTELDVATEELDSAPSCSSASPGKWGQSTTDEGIFSGGEDKSVAGSDSTTTRSTGSSSGVGSRAAVTADKFQSWNDLFGHLKKEITEMRERDVRILESLKSAESHLHCVRGLDRSRSEYATPLSRILAAPTTIPAGSLRPPPTLPRTSTLTSNSTTSSSSTSRNSTKSASRLRSTFV
uniref:Uncharacterized protein n=1 Tax=Panagrellus redivivus TaxID=6233 RepID=A0A7E4UZU9_PANRE